MPIVLKKRKMFKIEIWYKKTCQNLCSIQSSYQQYYDERTCPKIHHNPSTIIKVKKLQKSYKLIWYCLFLEMDSNRLCGHKTLLDKSCLNYIVVFKVKWYKYSLQNIFMTNYKCLFNRYGISHERFWETV